MLNTFREIQRIVGPEAKVIAVVVVGLLLGESGMRSVQHRLSVDVGHLQSFHQKSEELNSAPQHPHILFLGNSMTRYGISTETFSKEFADQTGVQPATMKINPDNTALADWYYAYRNYFFENGHAPDVLVIGFEGGHLRDKPTNHPGRLAQYYCDLGDWPELCQYDLKTLEDRTAYLVCTASAMCSNRDRLQRRILDTLIPGYRDGSQELNARQSRLAERKLPPPTYNRLREFLGMTRDQHVSVMLASMPIAKHYDLDPELLRVLREEQVQLIDCQNIPGIVPEMFPDGVHMTSAASQIYSHFLADALAQQGVDTARSTPPERSAPYSASAFLTEAK